MRSRIVYSTGVGTLCPNCRRAVRDCICPVGTPGGAAGAAGIRAGVRVGRATQGRAGRGVTTVGGLPLSAADLEKLAAQLKKRCGAGGTVQGGVIEIQGEHRDTVLAELLRLGFAAKRSGG